jgi:branched-subunit amino acid aminotransferase/4-amino-4-deoxychorismate lyase
MLEEAVAVPVGDRVFEHGLGLFETTRAVGGFVPLLPYHLRRMTQSAAELGLPLERAALPDKDAIGRLLAANHIAGDAVIRMTLSGGTTGGGGALFWMRPAPLPPAAPAGGAVVDFAGWTLAKEEPLARHKTLNYWSRRLAYEQGRARHTDEVLFATPDGRYWEGSRTNLFLIRGNTLVTPGLDGPVLPGIMRGRVLELAPNLSLVPVLAETGISHADLMSADEVFLTNAVRGVVAVGRITDRQWPAPGPGTQRFREAVDEWFQPEEPEA